jgi:hypothetical protein
VVVLDEGNQAEIHGVTRDVSAKGVFFWVGYWSPKAGEFRFKMIFPAEITHAEGARAICRGRTVRIESPSTPGRTGIAAIIDVVKLGM